MSSELALFIDHFDDYRRLVDEGYKEIQRRFAVGDFADAALVMQASVESQTRAFTALQEALNR